MLMFQNFKRCDGNSTWKCVLSLLSEFDRKASVFTNIYYSRHSGALSPASFMRATMNRQIRSQTRRNRSRATKTNTRIRLTWFTVRTGVQEINRSTKGAKHFEKNSSWVWGGELTILKVYSAYCNKPIRLLTRIKSICDGNLCLINVVLHRVDFQTTDIQPIHSGSYQADWMREISISSIWMEYLS